MNLNKELAYEAKKNGICKDWFNRLQVTEDKDELIKMYLDGIDFCLSNDYPPRTFFKPFDGIRQKYGVFLDEQIETVNSRHVVALGTSEGSASFTDFEVGQVFVKHEAKVEIKASGNAFVMVDVFDDAEVEVIASDNAKVCVNRYGGFITSTTGSEGNAVIKVIQKHSNNY